MTLFWILVGITALFAVFLGAKVLFDVRFCALCLASSGAWVALLLMYWLGAGLVVDPVMIALLAGATMLGVYYLVEKHVPEAVLMFRLPFYLTLFVGFVWIFGEPSYSHALPIFLIGLWVMFFLIFALRKSSRAKNIAEHIVACCRDW